MLPIENNKKSVGTIVYHCTEALDCPLRNNRTMIPRFMMVYKLSVTRQVYNKHKRRSHLIYYLA